MPGDAGEVSSRRSSTAVTPVLVLLAALMATPGVTASSAASPDGTAPGTHVCLLLGLATIWRQVRGGDDQVRCLTSVQLSRAPLISVGASGQVSGHAAGSDSLHSYCQHGSGPPHSCCKPA